MSISDIMNVIFTSKKAILDIWNNIDIRNTFSHTKTENFDNLIIDIRNSHFY